MHQVSFQVKMVPKHSGLEPMLPSVFACVLIALRYSHSHSSPYPISCSFPLFNLPYRLYAPSTLFTVCHTQIHLFVHSVFVWCLPCTHSSPGLHTFTHTGRFLCYCPLPLLASGDLFLIFCEANYILPPQQSFPNNLSSLLSFSFNEKSLNFFSEVSCFDSIICSLSHKCCGRLIQGPSNDQKN